VGNVLSQKVIRLLTNIFWKYLSKYVENLPSTCYAILWKDLIKGKGVIVVDTNFNQSIHKIVSPEFSQTLRLFCDQINGCDADIFVLLAQKAFCFFEVLIEQHLIKSDIQNKYISSAALDFDALKDFSGKVAVVDDIMITGSSISIVANKLMKNGIPEENIQIIALARDEDYQTIQFSNSATGKSIFSCAILASDAVCINFSSQICHVLAYYGKPYDSDFASFKKSKVLDINVSELLNPTLYDIYRVSNSNVQDDAVVWTLFPKAAVKERLWRYLGIDLNKQLHLKIRTYIYRHPNGMHTICTVPMALLHEIAPEELHDLYLRIMPQQLLNGGQELALTAKLRLLQFYIACALYKVSKSFTSCPDAMWPAFEQLRPLFGDVIAANIEKHFAAQTFRLSDSNIPSFSSSFFSPNLHEYTDTFNIKSIADLQDEHGYELNHALLALFTWWDEINEYPSRAEIANNPKHYKKHFRIIEGIRSHLPKGFTLRALQEIVRAAEPIFNTEHLVSVFLDRAIDHGYVVPITCEDSTSGRRCVYRAYRHGEDLPFGKADWIRLLYFLKNLDCCLQEENGKSVEYIADISIHKMIVLFYQLGLKNGHLFNRFLGFENDPFLEERFCVHGAVQAVRMNTGLGDATPPYLSAEDEDTSDDMDKPFTTYLINKLIEGNYIKRDTTDSNYIRYYINKDKIDHYLGENETACTTTKKARGCCLDPEIKTQIEDISKVIAAWHIHYASEAKKDEFKTDITALTSCCDIYTFVSAIMTEVYYFKRYWTLNALDLVNYITQGQDIPSSDFNIVRIEKALHSGREKHRLFLDQKAQETIQKVSEILLQENMRKELEKWHSWWRIQEQPNFKITGSPIFLERKDKLLRYLYYYSACYEWLTKGGLTLESSYSPQHLNAYEQYKDYFQYTAQEDFAKLSLLSKKSPLSLRAKLFKRHLNRKIAESDKLIDEITASLSERASSYTIEYSSALLIRINESNQRITDKLMREIWNELDENIEKTKINIIPFAGAVGKAPFQSYGIFYEGSGPHAFSILNSVFLIFFKKACCHAYLTDAILIPRLPSSAIFKHNLRRNILRHADDFYNSFWRPISNCLNDSLFAVTHRLYLLLTVASTEEESEKYIEALNSSLSFFSKAEANVSVDCDELDAITKYIPYSVGTNLKIASTPSARIVYDGKTIGSGLLFRENGDVFCISCQHLLKDYLSSFEEQKLFIQLENNELIPLIPLNLRFQQLQEDCEAKEDVLVLRPILEDFPIYDGSAFFTRERCRLDDKWAGEDMSCFGFPPGFRKGHNITITCHRGYVQTGYIEGTAEKYRLNEKRDDDYSGCSGAGLIDRSGRLVGIHSKQALSDPSTTLAIPIDKVLETIHSIQNDKG